MKTLITLLFTGVAFATAPLITGVTVGYVSHTSVRVLGTSNTSISGTAVVRIKYGLSGGSLDKSTKLRTVSAASTAIGHVVSGLLPATPYDFQLCATTDAEGCSSTVSQTTAALPANRYARPTPPAVTAIRAMDTSFTRDETTNSSDLNDGSTGLQAYINDLADDAGAGNMRIVVPAGTYDAPSGNGFTLKARSGGGTGWITIICGGTIVPEGTRQTTASPCKIRARSTNPDAGGVWTADANATKYRIVGFDNTVALNASSCCYTISSVAGSVITPSTMAGVTNGVTWYFGDDNGNYIRNGRISNTTATTFEISASSATVGTISPGWYMTLTNNTSGFLYNCLVCFSADTTGISNIIFDRNRFYGDHFPFSMTAVALNLNAQNVWVVGNSITDIDFGRFIDPVDSGVEGSLSVAPSAVGLKNSRYITIENNYINTPGISIFSQAGNGTYVADDVLIKRNTFEWDLKHWPDPANTEWNQMYVDTRQHIELKNGRRWLITGNDFKNMYDQGIVGTLPGVILLTPRAADSVSVASSTNGITDIIVEYNTVHHVPGFMVYGAYDGDGVSPQVEPTKRFLIQHNLVYDLDGYTYAVSGSTDLGVFFYGGGIEDIVVQNNTFLPPEGGVPKIWWAYHENGSGLMFCDNIIGLSSTDPMLWETAAEVVPTASGTTVYERMSALFSGAATIKNNLFVTGVAASATPDYTTNGISKLTCDAMWTGDTTNICATGTTANNRLDSLKWLARSAATPNYDLRYDSPGISGAHFTTNSNNVGADIPAMLAAQGKMTHVPKLVMGSTKKLRYIAPDTVACWYQINTDAAVSDGGGARVRNITVDLTGATTLTHWCGSEKYSIPVTGGSGVLQ